MTSDRVGKSKPTGRRCGTVPLWPPLWHGLLTVPLLLTEGLLRAPGIQGDLRSARVSRSGDRATTVFSSLCLVFSVSLWFKSEANESANHPAQERGPLWLGRFFGLARGEQETHQLVDVGQD